MTAVVRLTLLGLALSLTASAIHAADPDQEDQAFRAEAKRIGFWPAKATREFQRAKTQPSIIGVGQGIVNSATVDPINDVYELSFLLVRDEPIIGVKTDIFENKPFVQQADFAVNVSVDSRDGESTPVAGIVHALIYPAGGNGIAIPRAIAPAQLRGTIWRGVLPPGRAVALRIIIGGDTGNAVPYLLGVILERSGDHVVIRWDKDHESTKLKRCSEDDKIYARYFELDKGKFATFEGAVFLTNTRIVTSDADNPRLVGYWPGENDSKERIAGRDGWPSENVGYDVRDGRRGIIFDGKSSVEVWHNEVFDLGSPFSVALWVRPEPGVPQSDFVTLVDKCHMEGPLIQGGGMTGPSVCRGWTIQLKPDGVVRFGVGCNTRWATADSNDGVRDGRWHHVACVMEKSALRIYKDGLLQGTPTPLEGTPVGNGGLLMFGRWALGGRWFKGAMGDIRIYQGALTDTQVREICNNAGTDGSSGR
jgi:hypothetical protein